MGSDVEQAVEEVVRPLVEAMGFSLVEAALNRARRLAHLRLVIHREPAVTLDDCAAVTRAVRAPLEAIEGLTNLALEVSSPGVRRRLKSWREYGIFRGHAVRLLLRDADEWIVGVIRAVEGDVLSLEQRGGLRRIAREDIRAGRLDETEEVRR